MAIIRVTYTNGDTDVYETSGGETWALAQELDEDPEVASYEVDTDVPDRPGLVDLSDE